MDMKRIFLYAIVIAAMALAGCGGNGGGGGNGNGGDNGAPVPTAAEMDLAAIRTALNLADDADRAMIVAAITALQGNQEMEDAVIAQLRTALGLEADATPAMILAAVMEAVGPGVDPNPAATEAAATKLTAIGVEAAQTIVVGLGGNAGLGADGAPGGGDDTYSLTIKRPRSGTEVEITDTALPRSDMDNPQFMKMADLPDGNRNGFPGSMHVRTMKADDDGNVASEVVVVRTDIAAPTPRPFALDGDNMGVYTLDVSTNTDNDSPSVTNEALAVDQTDMDVLALVKSSAFMRPEAGVNLLTFNDDDPATADMDEAYETAGTYNDAMGTYRCNGTADCTVSFDADGKISAMSDGWIFTPDAMVTVDVEDSSYLAYGFWLSRTANSAGVVTKYNEVETFAMATGYEAATLPSDGTSVNGTATYSGGAAGVYVRNVTNDDGSIFSATSGHFQADVELNANFHGGNVAANKQLSISGTVDNFTLSGGEDNDWAVDLGLADFGSRTGDAAVLSMDRQSFGGAPTAGENTFSGTATGDSTAGTGSWSGTFWGSSAVVDGVNPQPTAVVGEFDANFTDGGVAGAYGATKD